MAFVLVLWGRYCLGFTSWMCGGMEGSTDVPRRGKEVQLD